MTTTNQEFKTFYHKLNPIFNPTNDILETALQNCQDEGFRVAYMPDVVDARIAGTAPWNQGFNTFSIKATGRTKQGNAVVVYAHMPNWLANPANIRTAKAQELIHGASHFPQEEFQRLLDAEDKQKVWVVDHEVLRKSKSGKIPLTQALEHPQTIPFLGGQERAERYLPKHAKAYDTETIGVWHSDDLNDDSPLVRLLCLGVNNFIGLYGGSFFGDEGQFAGVRHASAEGAQREKL